MISPDKNYFDYTSAFSRNIGWLTHEEQAQLREKCIAIAGMGGVGGNYLLTLARLGVTHFKIADLDTFETANINRQVGAHVYTLGRAKVDVLKEMAIAINPDICIETYPDGLDANNITSFLSDADLFLDGIDFFALELRSHVFAACKDLNIPAMTAAPLGMGCAYLLFMPDHMSFESYFGLAGKSETEQAIRFLLGLSPKAVHAAYLVDKSRIDLKNKRGPSTMMACQLCAGIVGTESLKILLRRGRLYPAPYYQLFDAYQQIFIRKKLWLGYKHPMQRIKAFLLNKQIRDQSL